MLGGGKKKKELPFFFFFSVGGILFALLGAAACVECQPPGYRPLGVPSLYTSDTWNKGGCTEHSQSRIPSWIIVKYDARSCVRLSLSHAWLRTKQSDEIQDHRDSCMSNEAQISSSRVMRMRNPSYKK